MKTITCDLCNDVIRKEPIRVTVRDGEHPHSGSTMTQQIDCCDNCIREIPGLSSNAELEELRVVVNQ